MCSLVHCFELSALFEGFLEATLHVESSFGELITRTSQEHLETFEGLCEFDELAGLSGEDFGHDERLREETLNLTGTSNGHLVFFREIVHTKNSNNVLKGSVILKQLLYSTSSVVMGLADNGRVKHTGGRVEGIDGGVNTELGQGTREHSSGVKMGECGGGGGIGKIISGYIDGLHGGNRAGLGGGNTLLKGTEIGGKSGLIADSGWNTAEQGRDLRASLGETEDVVDEKKHVLIFLISEVLCNGETSETDTSAGSWGLVHLTVHKGGFGSWATNLDDTGVDHFVV